MHSYEELEERLKINLSSLDTETSDHVQLYHEVGKGYRKALSVRDTAKSHSKEVLAQTQLDVREFLGESGSRVTDSMVQAQSEIDDAYRKSIDDLQAAEETLACWSNLKASYEQKSYALRDIIQLYVAGYFGALPAVSAGEQHSAHQRNRKLEQLDKLGNKPSSQESKLVKRPTKRQRLTKTDGEANE